jgi:hypothetical protein
MNDKKLLQFSRQKITTLGEAKVERVVPNALPIKRGFAANFRLWTPVVASSYSDCCCGRVSGYLLYDSLRKTLLL